jgi:hypothetical protein
VQIIDEMRGKLRMMHRALKTERAYIAWVQKYISFLAQLPVDISSEEKFERYMTHLAVQCHLLHLLKIRLLMLSYLCTAMF